MFVLTCFALFVFAIALLATAPARSLARAVSLPPQLAGLSGGLWQGRAHLEGGLALDWTLVPAELLRGRLAADLVLSGPASLARGRLAAGANGAVRLTGLDGRLGPDALALAGSGADLSCVLTTGLHGVRITHGPGGASAGGRISVTDGTCNRPGATTMQVPAGTVTLGTSGARATASFAADTAPDTPLAGLALGAERIDLRVEPEGAALVPGLPRGGPIELQYPL
ncbi:type II secretion system protein N [Profundibacterium mesophilum]|uniref:type II secretion system protein N n=1 Tax=Profundibacterium mesophilum TaxID=1258573 RepID=UPI00135CEB04|nr:type II secretion system protein N [Profundibacterium mesophilum]